jgi:hypothetical protein
LSGYFQASIPIGEGRFAAGVALCSSRSGSRSRRRPHSVGALHDAAKAEAFPPSGRAPFDGMEEVSPGFYRCRENALVLVPPPPAGRISGPVLLSLVFRPVVRRAPRAALKEAA